MLVAAVPGGTHWASAESISAGVGGRRGKEEQEVETCPWHFSPELCPYQVPTPPWAPSSCPWTCLNPWLAAITLHRATHFLGAYKPQSVLLPI